MSPRQKIAAAFAVAVVMTGIAAGIAAAHPVGAPAPQHPVTGGPNVSEPGDGPDTPGLPDLPEPGDTPDSGQ